MSVSFRTNNPDHVVYFSTVATGLLFNRRQHGVDVLRRPGLFSAGRIPDTCMVLRVSRYEEFGNWLYWILSSMYPL